MTCVIGGLGPQAQKAVRVTSTLSICLRLKVSFKFAQCSIVPMLSLLREHGPWSRSLSPDPPQRPPNRGRDHFTIAVVPLPHSSN